jgi:S1-C subfamily serine protease
LKGEYCGERRSNVGTNAQKAGIRRGDIVIAYGDRTDRLTESGIIGYVLQEKPQAKTLPVKLLRNGEQVEVELSLE